MKKKIYAASAVAPCTTHRKAMEHIASGLADPFLGKISPDKVQICPQHSGYISEDTINTLMEENPETEFRLHASPKMRGAGRHLVFTSNAADHGEYTSRALEMTRVMGSRGYSLHAGRREHCDMASLIGKAQQIQDLCPETRMAVEGLYPDRRNQWLMSTWSEYEMIADSGVGFALDLSHLNIVANREGRQDVLVENMAGLPNCVEIHVSHNNGRADTHRPVPEDHEPWWMKALEMSHPEADIFYEGILVAPHRSSAF